MRREATLVACGIGVRQEGLAVRRVEDDSLSELVLVDGLDVIGGWLTGVNVTGPTGIQEIDALDGVRRSTRCTRPLDAVVLHEVWAWPLW